MWLDDVESGWSDSTVHSMSHAFITHLVCSCLVVLQSYRVGMLYLLQGVCSLLEQ